MLGYRATFWMTGIYLITAGLLMLFLVDEEFTPVERTDQGPFWAKMRGDISTLFVGSLLGLVLGLRFALRLGMRIASPMVPLVVQEMLPAGALLGSASGLLTTISGIASALSAPLLGRIGDQQGGRAEGRPATARPGRSRGRRHAS